MSTGVKKFLSDNDLVTTSQPKPWFPSHCDIKEGTRKKYQGVWNGLKNFAALIGDYQSVVLLDRELCPDKPLPLLPKTVCLYMDYRCRQNGTDLTWADNPVVDVTGNVVKAAGGWESVCMLWNYRSESVV